MDALERRVATIRGHEQQSQHRTADRETEGQQLEQELEMKNQNDRDTKSSTPHTCWQLSALELLVGKCQNRKMG
jgi:hypothetical protein